MVLIARQSLLAFATLAVGLRAIYLLPALLHFIPFLVQTVRQLDAI